jgi:uncharacterized protein
VLTPPTPPDAPTAPEGRLASIDIVRGVALLGIFVVNMLFFSAPAGYFGLTRYWPGAVNAWLEAAVRIFFQGAFYSLFSFLFGLGFALQLRRTRAALPRFRRRLLVLAGIGTLHATLIWYGDILLTYAVAGFMLVPFAFRRTWVLIAGAVTFLVLSSGSYLGFWDLGLAGRAPWLTLATFDRTFGEGSYLEVVRYQLRLLGREVLNFPSLLPTVLWLFLLGLLAGRYEVFARPNRRLWLEVLAAALPFALVFKGFYATWLVTGVRHPFSLAFSFALGGPALMFVYLALLNLLLAREWWRRRLGLFGAAGRMALSNYLGQSLLCTLLFNGYGLGYWGELDLTVTLPLVLVIFALQAALSALWLRHFRFGPAEWVWRSLTYGAPQPLRHTRAPGASS